ncbi:MAG: Clp protease N-terminal domain-containing protein, partial [Amnibacterium sp.]
MPEYFGPAAGDGSFDEFLARLLQSQRSASSGRPIDISRLLSRRTHEVVGTAVRFAVEHGHAEVDALHLLHALVSGEQGRAALSGAGIDVDALLAAVEERMPAGGERVAGTPGLTPYAQRALMEAVQVARAFGSTYVDPEHLFFAFVANQHAAAGQLLAAHGVTPDQLQRIAQGGAAAGEAEPQSETPTLDQFGTDLTARAREHGLDPVIGRTTEVEQVVEILLRRTKN